MLYLIGTGLYYLNDLPFRAVDIIKSCKEVYLETYTNPIDTGSLMMIERVTGKDIKRIARTEVEGDILVEKARHEDIALLIPGDPLSATTHISLILGCKENNVAYEILHSGSIFTAVAETGLSMYKFGAVTSMPIYRRNYAPESFFDVITLNLKNGLHTLLLLEAENEENFLSAEEAVLRLKAMEKSRGLSIIDWEGVIAISRAGSRESRMWMAGKKSDAEEMPPISIIIPGDLSRTEQEAVSKLIHKD